MSSTRLVDLRGKGNQLIESIPDYALLTRPTYSPSATRLRAWHLIQSQYVFLQGLKVD